MRFMILVKGTKSTESGALPGEKLLAEMARFNEELARAGVLRSAEGLHPTAKGVRVTFSGKSRIVTHGPFADDGQIVAGYWILETRTLEEALEWVRRCPNPTDGESEMELRPIFDPDAPVDRDDDPRRREEALLARVDVQFLN
jgi:hypothetical protein